MKIDLSWEKNKQALIYIVIFFAVFGLYRWYVMEERQTEEVVTQGTDNVYEDDIQLESLSEKEAVDITFDTLDILHSLYYISQDESEDGNNDQAFISNWMGELMKDRNKYDKVIIKAQELANNSNDAVSTIGLGILTGISQLVKTNEEMVAYLRTVDVYNLDMSEFTYQANLHGANNKKGFNSIIESSILLPYLYMDYSSADDESEVIPILLSQKSQEEILSEIDRLFGDIFPEHDIWHQETGNTHASVFVVRNYIDFLTGKDASQN